MPKKVNTFTRFLPLSLPGGPKPIIKNECYFSVVFLGGNYLSSGSLLQKIFGGSDEVVLIAGLRLPPDGLVITAMEEPNIVLDKRSIKPGINTNIPLVLNILVKIPAYMDNIGFSFKIITTKRSDNFSVALDVLNDSGNKAVLNALVPGVVGKALGIGKVVKDLFDKVDAARNHDLIQLVVNDFIVPASASSLGANNLQEGYLVIFVKDENEIESVENELESFKGAGNFTIDDGFNHERTVEEEKTVFVNVSELEKTAHSFTEMEAAVEEAPLNLIYDELNKILKMNDKVVTNTYLVFKIQKDTERGENVGSAWSKKFNAAVHTLSDEFDKTPDKLKELLPRAVQLLNEATALLSEEPGFTPSEKDSFKTKYINLITAEKVKFGTPA